MGSARHTAQTDQARRAQRHSIWKKQGGKFRLFITKESPQFSVADDMPTANPEKFWGFWM